MSEELTSCPKCEGLKPTATPVEILRAHESYLSYGFGYCGHLMDEHIAERMVRADRERVKRLEAVLDKVIPYAPTGVGMMARAVLKEGP